MRINLYKAEGNETLPDFSSSKELNDPANYIPSQELVDAVNIAMLLGQPLLLTGEPGTGKTQLAYHLAHFFKLDQPLVFNVQTSSLAADLFYKYDALGHFQYNQNNKERLSPAEIEEQFITYNALGQAIRSQKRVVVLIDEIDKAPRDLPNDILFAIEHMRFKVSEINQEFVSDEKNRPIIIMTSNSEKNLPDAFLRRVAYFHITFPSADQLLYILSRRTNNVSIQHLKKVVQYFSRIRDLQMKKPPSTAELIYWTFLLLKLKFPIERLGETLDTYERKVLLSSYVVLTKNKEDLDLLKNLL